jgi:hypothetical protein
MPPVDATKQGKLPIKAGDKYSQKDITGTKVIKETAPKEVLDRADTFMLRKADHTTAKSNMDKAADHLLACMAKHNCTQVKVKDAMGVAKRIIVKQGEERLKTETCTD